MSFVYDSRRYVKITIQKEGLDFESNTVRCTLKLSFVDKYSGSE